MTSVYTGTPSSESPIDEVRFNAQDVTEPFKLTDQEILALLAKHNDNVGRASVAASIIIAAKYAGKVDRKIGDLSISASQKTAHYLAISEAMQSFNKANIAPVPFAGGIGGEPSFKRGLHGA